MTQVTVWFALSVPVQLALALLEYPGSSLPSTLYAPGSVDRLMPGVSWPAKTDGEPDVAVIRKWAGSAEPPSSFTTCVTTMRRPDASPPPPPEGGATSSLVSVQVFSSPAWRFTMPLASQSPEKLPT